MFERQPDRTGGSRSAVLHALSPYSNAVLTRGKIDVGELHEETGTGLAS
jgi:hypothetical protein